MMKITKSIIEKDINTDEDLILTCDVRIVGNVNCRDIVCEGGDWNIDCWDIVCRDIECWNIDCGNIICSNIDCQDIDCWDIDCRNITCEKAVCNSIDCRDIAYEHIDCLFLICETRKKKNSKSKTICKGMFENRSKLKKKEW